MVLLTVLVVSTVALAYALYVAMLVKEAGFYSRAQKIAHCMLILVVPVLGAALMHWLYLRQKRN
jgi:hypothetical protein